MAYKEYQLNVPERLILLSLLNDFKGSLDTLGTVLEDIKLVKFTEEELAAYGITFEGTAARWNPEKDAEAKIALQKDTVKYIKEKIESKDTGKELTINDAPLLSLKDKIV